MKCRCGLYREKHDHSRRSTCVLSCRDICSFSCAPLSQIAWQKTHFTSDHTREKCFVCIKSGVSTSATYRRPNISYATTFSRKKSIVKDMKLAVAAPTFRLLIFYSFPSPNRVLFRRIHVRPDGALVGLGEFIEILHGPDHAISPGTMSSWNVYKLGKIEGDKNTNKKSECFITGRNLNWFCTCSNLILKITKSEIAAPNLKNDHLMYRTCKGGKISTVNARLPWLHTCALARKKNCSRMDNHWNHYQNRKHTQSIRKRNYLRFRQFSERLLRKSIIRVPKTINGEKQSLFWP